MTKGKGLVPGKKWNGRGLQGPRFLYMFCSCMWGCFAECPTGAVLVILPNRDYKHSPEEDSAVSLSEVSCKLPNEV